MRQQEVGYALVGVDLVFHAREPMPFVIVNLVIHGAPALLDCFHDLLGLRLRAARIVSSR